MRYASEAEQRAFHGGMQKQLRLTFSDGTIIENEDIALEDMYFEQSLCDEEQFRYGTVSASHLHVRVLGVTQRFKGLNLHVEITATDVTTGEEFTQSIGYFRVESDKATSDRIYRDLECYDKLYDVLTTDYSAWHNTLTFPLTLKQYRDAFFNYIGITQEEITLVNDNLSIPRNFVADGYPGSEVLRNILEINGVSGHISFNGNFRYVEFSVVHDGLFPHDTLYPSDELYPKDVDYYRLTGGEYQSGSLVYEEFECQTVTQLQIRMNEGDIGAVVGSAGNTYIIQNNPILYGLSSTQLRSVAENALTKIRILYFTPSSITTPASPWYELGDVLTVIGVRDTIIICMLNRKMSGITALKDDYSCKGQEYYSEPANGTNYSIQILKQKSNELSRSVEETRSTITQVETTLNGRITETQSQIVQTSTQIKMTVSKTQREWDTAGIPYVINLYGYTTPDAAGYAAKNYSGKYYLNRNNGAVYYSNGSTWSQKTVSSITCFGYTNSPADNGYPAKSYNGQYYLNQANGYVYQSNGTTWNKITRTCSLLQNVMQSQITQNANSINLKVSQGQVISQLNLEVKNGVGTVTITGNRISISSDYFVLNANGSITKCTSANIGGWTIDATSFRSGTSKASGVYLAPATAVNRSISNIGTKTCLFAIGSNFGVGSDGTVYANGAVIYGTIQNIYTSGGRTNKVIVSDGQVNITNNSAHNCIHMYNGDGWQASLGADDVYTVFKDDGDWVYITAGWGDIADVGAHRDKLKRMYNQYMGGGW